MSIQGQIIKEGLEYLSISDTKIIFYIKEGAISNYYWRKKEELKRIELEKWNNRYKVPKGESKTFYKNLLKETQEKIYYFLEKGREFLDIVDWYEILREPYIEKKKKIKNLLEYHNDFGDNNNLAKAKEYPIENLLDFDGGGFIKCLWHEEKTGSCKLYKNSNIVYCFGGCGKKDSIDVYMQLHNVTLSEAIKKLC